MLAYARYGAKHAPTEDFRENLASGLRCFNQIGDWNAHGTQGYFAANDQFAILAFRGTEVDDPVDVIDDADLRLVPDLDLRPGGTAPRFVLGIHSSLAVRLLEVEMARSAKVLPGGKASQARFCVAAVQYLPLFDAARNCDSEGEFSMAGIVALKAGDTDVLIAVRRNPNDVTPVASLDDKINQTAETLESKFQVIRGIAVDLAESLKTTENLIKEAELEFGLSLSGKGNLYVVETTVEATFKVTLKLEFKQT